MITLLLFECCMYLSKIKTHLECAVSRSFGTLFLISVWVGEIDVFYVRVKCGVVGNQFKL